MTLTPAGDPGPVTIARQRLGEVLPQVLASLDGVSEPSERFFAAELAERELGPFATSLRTAKRDAIREMRHPHGLTDRPVGWADIGAELGLTPQRAQQLAALPGDRHGPRPLRSDS